MLIYFVVGMFLVFLVFLLFTLLTRKFDNPYKLIMVFGKKGSGKSTLIAKLAKRYIKKGRIVYSNVELNIPGVRLFDVQDIGRRVFPEESIIFIDEVGMIWDNRDYKNFRTDVRDYFKLQRHYRNTVYLFSQTFDIDVKLRNLTDHMFMVKCYGNVFSIAHRVSRKLVVVEPTGDSEGRIADGYELVPLWLQLVGLRIAYFTYIPRWTKYFNSFEQADIPCIDFDEVCFCDVSSDVPSDVPPVPLSEDEISECQMRESVKDGSHINPLVWMRPIVSAVRATGTKIFGRKKE